MAACGRGIPNGARHGKRNTDRASRTKVEIDDFPVRILGSDLSVFRHIESLIRRLHFGADSKQFHYKFVSRL